MIVFNLIVSTKEDRSKNGRRSYHKYRKETGYPITSIRKKQGILSQVFVKTGYPILQVSEKNRVSYHKYPKRTGYPITSIRENRVSYYKYLLKTGYPITSIRKTAII